MEQQEYNGPFKILTSLKGENDDDKYKTLPVPEQE